MDSFKPQNVKPRRTKSIMKKSRVQRLSDLFFRTIEIMVVMVTVTKLIYQLVTTFENSSKQFRGVAVLFVNRHFVFILGNTIIIALFAKSGWNPNQASDPQGTNNCLYEEFVRESRREERDSRVHTKTREKQSTRGEKKKQSIGDDMKKQTINASMKKHRIVECKEKASIGESVEKQSIVESRKRQSIGESMKKQSTSESTAENRKTQNRAEERKIQKKTSERSQSENLEESKSSAERLRRSETDKFGGKFRSDGEKTRDLELSHDELRYKIESFIARQRRSQMDEEFSII